MNSRLALFLIPCSLFLSGCTLPKNAAWKSSQEVQVTVPTELVPTTAPSESLDELEKDVANDDLDADVKATNDELKTVDKELQGL